MFFRASEHFYPHASHNLIHGCYILSIKEKTIM